MDYVVWVFYVDKAYDVDFVIDMVVVVIELEIP